MLRDGMYRLSYPRGQTGGIETALALVRDGQLLASDPRGGVYQSTSCEAVGDGHVRITIRCLVPPGGELASGQKVGAKGLSLSAEVLLDPYLDEQSIQVTIAGKGVDIHATYLGPLPN